LEVEVELAQQLSVGAFGVAFGGALGGAEICRPGGAFDVALGLS